MQRLANASITTDRRSVATPAQARAATSNPVVIAATDVLVLRVKGNQIKAILREYPQFTPHFEYEATASQRTDRPTTQRRSRLVPEKLQWLANYRLRNFIFGRNTTGITRTRTSDEGSELSRSIGISQSHRSNTF